MWMCICACLHIDAGEWNRTCPILSHANHSSMNIVFMPILCISASCQICSVLIAGIMPRRDIICKTAFISASTTHNSCQHDWTFDILQNIRKCIFATVESAGPKMLDQKSNQIEFAYVFSSVLCVCSSARVQPMETNITCESVVCRFATMKRVDKSHW